MIKEFELIYGPRPFGPRTQEMKTAQLRWAQNLAAFGGIASKSTPELVLKEYVENGLGEPIYYHDRRFGLEAAFPNSKFGPLTGFNAEVVLGFPDAIVASAQVNAIKDGFYVERLHDTIPSSLTLVNEANRAKSTPTVESPTESPTE